MATLQNYRFCLEEQTNAWTASARSPYGAGVVCFWRASMGRGVLLWLLGVPIPIILLLWLFFGR